MNTEKLKRYDRQMILPELGLEGQLKLMNSSVLVVGAGGLGCPALLYLAAAGIGRIGIIDHDIVDETNLHRQILYNRNDLGKLKAELAVQKLKRLNPDVNLEAYSFKLVASNASQVISEYDVVMDGSDNFATRYLVNDTCVAWNKPLVFGSIFQFEGQVSVFNYQCGPDYRSLYPEPPAYEDITSCGESGVIGTLPGFIGSIMANETIKIIVGFGEILSGELLVFNALNNETQRFKFNKLKSEISAMVDLDEQSLENHLVSNKKPREKQRLSREIDTSLLEYWKTLGISFQLVDIREAYEYEENNIGGLNIPLYELNEQIGQLAFESKVVFCCTSGTRSKIAVNLLKSQYNTEVFTLILPQHCKI